MRVSGREIGRFRAATHGDAHVHRLHYLNEGNDRTSCIVLGRVSHLVCEGTLVGWAGVSAVVLLSRGF